MDLAPEASGHDLSRRGIRKELIFGGVTGVSDKGGAYAGSIQAWLPVKDIIKGVVITRDKRFIKIVELLSVNFYTMPEMEKGTAIADLAAYLKIAPSNLQINVLTQKFDLNSYTKMLRGALERERNGRCREMIEESLVYVPQLVQREAITAPSARPWAASSSSWGRPPRTASG